MVLQHDAVWHNHNNEAVAGISVAQFLRAPIKAQPKYKPAELAEFFGVQAPENTSTVRVLPTGANESDPMPDYDSDAEYATDSDEDEE
jgi:hypothetical protein